MDENSPPLPLSLHFCDLLIIEAVTRKVSMIGGFQVLDLPHFPAAPDPFRVWTYLSDYLGECTISLEVRLSGEEDEIYRIEEPWYFMDKVRPHLIFLTIRDCVFPSPGTYEFELLVNQTSVGFRRLTVREPRS